MQPDQDLEAIAQTFLIACYARDEAARNQHLKELWPRIERQVKKQCRLATLPNGLLEKDILQEVLYKLIKTPPDPAPSDMQALPRLLSWVNTTTFRYISSCWRPKEAHAVLSMPSEKLEKFENYSPYDPTRSASSIVDHPIESMHRMQMFILFKEYLEKEYPRGYQYVCAFYENYGATTEELADLLKISTDNLYQIRNRVQRYLLIFNKARRLDKGERAE
jgi:hypothetical protein